MSMSFSIPALFGAGALTFASPCILPLVPVYLSLNWADLLRRIYDVDALRCPRCEGRLQFIAVVTERASIRRVLEHLGESATGPPPERAVAWAG